MVATTKIPEKDLRKYTDQNPLDEISLTSAILGIVLGISICALPLLKFKPIGVYLISLSVFHFLEFFITARYNVSKVNKDSFLINNGLEYIAAHALALAEAYIENLIFPNLKRSFVYVKLIGVVLVIVGQVMRSLAMITAAESFSHIVSEEKKNDHVLVKHGIYSVSRHPSYAGFFYWAIGTELLLLNPICFVGFCVALWGFFHKRIRFEEEYLVVFFEDEYVKYREVTGTLIPFI